MSSCFLWVPGSQLGPAILKGGLQYLCLQGRGPLLTFHMFHSSSNPPAILEKTQISNTFSFALSYMLSALAGISLNSSSCTECVLPGRFGDKSTVSSTPSIRILKQAHKNPKNSRDSLVQLKCLSLGLPFPSSRRRSSAPGTRSALGL